MSAFGRWLVAGTAVTAVTLLVAACGSSDDNASSGSSTSGGGQGAATSKLTKSPIKLGIINQERAPDASFPEFSAAARSAVEYVNNDMGGVDGHPLTLEICTTDASPASSTNCAAEMVQKKVIAVTQSLDYGEGASLPVLAKAGIPMLGGEPGAPTAFTAKEAAYFVGGSSATVPALLTFAKDYVHAKTVGIMYAETTGGEQARELTTKLGEQMGLKIVPAADPQTAADLTGSVSKLAKTDAIIGLHAQQICGRIMAAHKQLNVQNAMVMPAVCSGKDVLEASQGGATGAYFSGEFKAPTTKGDPDVDTFLKLLKKYPQPKADPNGIYTEMGVSNMMNIATLLREVIKEKGDAGLTSAALWAHVKQTVNHANFLAPPYSCAKPPLGNNAPTVCNVGQIFSKYDGSQMQDATGGKFIDISKGG
jgi:branched-chain amino acid transport system substrate-binding protein